MEGAIDLDLEGSVVTVTAGEAATVGAGVSHALVAVHYPASGLTIRGPATNDKVITGEGSGCAISARRSPQDSMARIQRGPLHASASLSPWAAMACEAGMVERPLEGGNAGGAVLVDGTVRRPAGPWTPSVHALLRHLEQRGFQGSPRALGVDRQGREILSFVPGATIGTRRPWPAWVHTDDALHQVGSWLRGYHDCVKDFVPAVGAAWRAGSHAWRPGDIIGHNDAAPYNAVWQTSPGGHTELVGFIDWDFASPCAPIRDLAFVASAWVPLHNRESARSQGFDDFAARPRRLRVLLDAYGWNGTAADVLDAVRARIVDHLRIVNALADRDPVFQDQADAGAQADSQLTDIQETLRQFDLDRPGLDPDRTDRTGRGSA